MSLHRIRIVIRRHLYVLWRAPHRWFDIAFWPLMGVILWGSLGTYVAQQDASSRASAPFLIGGAMMFHVLFQSQIAVATGFMEETWSRNLMNVLTTPVTEFEYIGGTAMLGIVKVLAALGVVSITAYAFFGFDTTAVGWSLVPISLILMIAGWGLGHRRDRVHVLVADAAQLPSPGLHHPLLVGSHARRDAADPGARPARLNTL